MPLFQMVFALGVAIAAFLGARLARRRSNLASILVVVGVIALLVDGFMLLLSMCGLGGGACP